MASARLDAILSFLFIVLVVGSPAAAHYDPELGRWLTRDKVGYIDGMSLYEFVGGNPTLYQDPSGSFIIWGSIGTKIRQILGYRFARKAPGGSIGPIFGADWIWGESYRIDDQKNEMPTGPVASKMDAFYKAYLDGLNIPMGKWLGIPIWPQSAKALVGQFTMISNSSVPGWDAGWWLGGGWRRDCGGQA